MSNPRPLDVMRQKIRIARRWFETGTKRPLRNRDLDSVVKNLRQVAWACDTYRGKGAAKGRRAMVAVVEALAEIYFARTTRERWERQQRLEFAGSMVADAYVAIHEMG